LNRRPRADNSKRAMAVSTMPEKWRDAGGLSYSAIASAMDNAPALANRTARKYFGILVRVAHGDA